MTGKQSPMETDDIVKPTNEVTPYGKSGSYSPQTEEFAAPDTSEAARLAELGYKAELPRNLSLVTVLGLSFSIIGAPVGLSTSISFSLTNGGAPTYFFGWIMLSAVTLAMAASLGELCSVWPTSGGVYVWSAKLAPTKYRRIVSFCTGWVTLVANVTLALSIAFGEAQLILGAAGMYMDADWAPEPWLTVVTFWAVMLLCILINLFGVRGRYLESLNTASMYWTGAAVVIVLVVLLVKAGATTGRRSAYEAFALWQNASGWPDGWSFFVGSLTAAYTLTGYGLVAQCCEEVSRPERAVPRAMVGSVLAGSLAGFVYILPVIFVLPLNLDEILTSGQGAIPALVHNVVGSDGGGFAMVFLLIIAGMFASIGGLTVALRFTWAFSRDGGLPFSSTWSVVYKPLQIPLNATIITSIVICLLGLIFIGSPAAFSAFTGAATVCLGVSYAVPIGISLFSGRKQVNRASWTLGPAMGLLANIVATAWIAFSVVLFSFPTTNTTDPESINYAPVVFCGFFFFAGIYYAVWAKKTYRGPNTAL